GVRVQQPQPGHQPGDRLAPGDAGESHAADKLLHAGRRQPAELYESGVPPGRVGRLVAAVYDPTLADRRDAVPVGLAAEPVPQVVAAGEDQLLDGPDGRVRQDAPGLQPPPPPGQAEQAGHLPLADAEDGADLRLVVALAGQVCG